MLVAVRRFLATVIAATLIVYGMASTDENANQFWLLCLAGAGVALLFAWWPSGTRTLPIFNRTMLRWGTIIIVAFFLVSVQLVKVQVVDSAQTYNRVVLTDSGDVFQNARVNMETASQRRGSVLDREDRVLAESVIRDDQTFERVYPEPSAAPLIGYYSPPLFGASQLEASFNDYLSGSEGGNPVVEWFDSLLHRERGGYDLRLTLDLELQQLAAELLGDRAGAVVLMDATTGEVLAMVGYPTYDPGRLYANAGQQTAEELAAINAYWEELLNDPASPLVFRPTQGLYTPGSTFKTVTASAAISENVADPEQVYRDEGSLNVDGRIIIELNRPDESKVDWTLEEAYSYSLNVVFAQVGLQLGAESLWEYGTRFGFDEAVPFDILTEAGQIAPSEEALLSSRALVADTAFGQGEILTTPLEMALVVSAIVNDGVMMEPFLVQEVLDDEGNALERFRPDQWREVVPAEVADAVRSMMLASVDYGFASNARIDGVTVGGKTGTAETGGDESHAWFTGFVEDGERELVVSVIVEGGGSGGEVALPIGRDLLEWALEGTPDSE
ncbi:penicillin-binding protein 2 [soil metagenome]